MPRFAANLSLMYAEHAFLDRFGAAASDGFEAVEFLFPYEFDPDEIGARLRHHGLKQVLFNLPPGDWTSGERGMACHPGREAEFMRGLRDALPYVQATGCRSLHVMAGRHVPGVSADLARATYVTNLQSAVRVAADEGLTLLIEPINTRDMPGYFLNYQQQAHEIVDEIGSPHLKVQMDFYHCQIMEGDLMRRLERHIQGIGHVQIAGVPDRHEPDRGEVAYPALFARLDTLGYLGWIGCEYRPAGATSAGLEWVRPYLRAGTD
ncbi:MAG: hypothetical protein RL322_3208 [Pseudomonadota bacterium]|jgi:hydroxypyruvate isomerase